MERKEHYKHILPHFQQPGQAYFVTWSLKDAVPPKALFRYTHQLKELRAQIEFQEHQNAAKLVIENLKNNYASTRRKYIKAYDDLLDTNKSLSVDLSKVENTDIMKEALHYWENGKLSNFAYSIMPTHVHWVFQLYERDETGNPVYLQDILQSVKRFTANRINKAENRQGSLWQRESFDTTIRNEKHLFHTIEYTLHNPIKAELVSDWCEWPGCWSGAAIFNLGEANLDSPNSK